LQEERLRRTLQREMPRITDELRALLEQVKSLAKPAVVWWSLTCFFTPRAVGSE
jgi:hypothetical protein